MRRKFWKQKLEAKRLELGQRMQENTLREEWRSSPQPMGDPEMERVTVAGDLERGWPELSDQEVLEAISKNSPAARIADAAAARNTAEVARAQRESNPRFTLARRIVL